MDLHLQKAQIQDIPVLNKISLASKSYWNYPKEWIDHWKEGLALTEKDFVELAIYKLILGDIILGFCAMNEFDKHYEIEHLWIDPKYIGKGYGKYLLNAAIEHVVVKQKDIILDADPNAVPFYNSQGFVTIGQKESYPKGRFLPIMKKATNEK